MHVESYPKMLTEGEGAGSPSVLIHLIHYLQHNGISVLAFYSEPKLSYACWLNKDRGIVGPMIFWGENASSLAKTIHFFWTLQDFKPSSDACHQVKLCFISVIWNRHVTPNEVYHDDHNSFIKFSISKDHSLEVSNPQKIKESNLPKTNSSALKFLLYR